jgi:hypothetical protein
MAAIILLRDMSTPIQERSCCPVASLNQRSNRAVTSAAFAAPPGLDDRVAAPAARCADLPFRCPHHPAHGRSPQRLVPDLMPGWRRRLGGVGPRGTGNPCQCLLGQGCARAGPGGAHAGKADPAARRPATAAGTGLARTVRHERANLRPRHRHRTVPSRPGRCRCLTRATRGQGLRGARVVTPARHCATQGEGVQR